MKYLDPSQAQVVSPSPHLLYYYHQIQHLQDVLFASISHQCPENIIVSNQLSNPDHVEYDLTIIMNKRSSIMVYSCR
jgi:hypothetical protein